MALALFESAALTGRKALPALVEEAKRDAGEGDGEKIARVVSTLATVNGDAVVVSAAKCGDMVDVAAGVENLVGAALDPAMNASSTAVDSMGES